MVWLKRSMLMQTDSVDHEQSDLQVQHHQHAQAGLAVQPRDAPAHVLGPRREGE